MERELRPLSRESPGNAGALHYFRHRMTANAPSSQVTALTRVLLIFLPLTCLGVNLALPRLPWQPQLVTSLDYSDAWLSQIAHQDSWKPMRAALRYLDQPGERELYQEIFFGRGIKLQYPPTSLLPLDALRRLPGADWTSDPWLNRISWSAVLACAFLSVAILLGAREPPAGGARSRIDAACLGALGLLAALTFYPLVRGYYLGQIQTWIDALAAGLVFAWLRGYVRIGGALAALCCLIKPQLGVLVIWALLRRELRFAASFAITLALAGVLSLAVYGLAAHLDYLEVLSYIGRHGESFHPNQSLNGLLNRMLSLGNNLTWEKSGFAPFDARVYWATLLSSSLLVGLALFWRRGEHERAGGLDLCIAITTLTIASPVAWTHHYAVLLPVFAVAVGHAWQARELGASRMWLLALAWLLVANNFRALNRLADTPLGFLQSYVYFGGLLLLFLLYRLRRVTAASA